MKSLHIPILCTLALCGGHALSQGIPPPQGAANQAAPANRVSIEVRGDYRIITANGIPDHPHGQFPNRGNPNAIREQRYVFRVPLKPRVAERITPLRHQPFGVALNGVVFDPGTAEFWNNDPRSGWNYEALSGKVDLGHDDSHAHVQPNGAYHYHGLPGGLIANLEKGRKAKQMTLVGYAADGFPIYALYGHAKAGDARSELRKLRSSFRLKTGTRPAEANGPGGAYDGTFVEDYEYVAGAGDLDECNGRFGATPEYSQGTYYYVLTEEFPFVPRNFRGTPDESFQRRGPGPGGQRPPFGPWPFPPPGAPPFPPSGPPPFPPPFPPPG